VLSLPPNLATLFSPTLLSGESGDPLTIIISSLFDGWLFLAAGSLAQRGQARLALALQSLGYLMEAPGEAYAVSQTQALINDPAQPSLACQGVGKLLNERGSMPPHP
jgi:hypothetical protein